MWYCVAEYAYIEDDTPDERVEGMSMMGQNYKTLQRATSKIHHESRSREPTPPRTHPVEVPPVQAMDQERIIEAVQLVLMQMAFSKDRDNLLSALSVMSNREGPHGQIKPTSTTGQTADAEGYEKPGQKRESQRYEHLNKDSMESPNEVC